MGRLFPTLCTKGMIAISVETLVKLFSLMILGILSGIGIAILLLN
jgi:hypothetical protein